MKDDENVVECTRGDDMQLKLLGVADAAKLLCISPKTLRNLVKAGEIPASEIGNKWLLKYEDVIEYIEKTKLKPNDEKEN